MWETKFHTHQNKWHNYGLYILTFMFLDKRKEDKKTLDRMLASIPQI
jgi:hypothetical protein